MLKRIIAALLTRLPEPLWFLIRLLRDQTHPLTRRRRREIAALDPSVRRLMGSAPPLPQRAETPRHLLIVQGSDSIVSLVEVAYALALIHAGWEVSLLTTHGAATLRWFRWAGVRRFEFWAPPQASVDGQVNAEQMRALGFEGVMAYRYLDAQVGMHGISKVIRGRRAGFDPRAPGIWEETAREVNIACAYAEQSRDLISRLKPEVILFNERGYNREGPFFDLANARGIECLQWVAAHRPNTAMFKRYLPGETRVSPYGLSDKTWARLKAMPWGEAQEQAVYEELRECYSSGTWFGEVGTQFNRAMFSSEALRADLGLDPARPTAIIFAHMFWDASFFYGVDLFRDYEEWFVEAIRAAVANPHLNWLVKAHPANVVKNRRENISGEKADMERTVIARQVGALPEHLHFIPSDTPISTYSLFPVMDYCLTVRGTIGMEAACFGIPVVTAGTGRYDRRGFTIDPESQVAYRETLARLHTLPRLSADQQQAALRFAYGSLLTRPLKLRAVTMETLQDEFASVQMRIRVDSAADLLKSPDLQAFVEWMGSPGEEDYLDLTRGPA